jgi:hypothetical protein
MTGQPRRRRAKRGGESRRNVVKRKPQGPTPARRRTTRTRMC